MEKTQRELISQYYYHGWANLYLKAPNPGGIVRVCRVRQSLEELAGLAERHEHPGRYIDNQETAVYLGAPDDRHEFMESTMGRLSGFPILFWRPIELPPDVVFGGMKTLYSVGQQGTIPIDQSPVLAEIISVREDVVQLKLIGRPGSVMVSARTFRRIWTPQSP